MTELLHRMQAWRQGMGVRRFHTIPGLGEQQTVGHHSCGVALIIVMCHPSPSAELLVAALTHDLSEGVLGDLPATTKWRSPALDLEWRRLEGEADQALGVPTSILSDEDSACLVLADNLEGLLYCAEQVRMGNLYFFEIAQRWAANLQRVDLWAQAPTSFRTLYDELTHAAGIS